MAHLWHMADIKITFEEQLSFRDVGCFSFIDQKFGKQTFSLKKVSDAKCNIPNNWETKMNLKIQYKQGWARK